MSSSSSLSIESLNDSDNDSISKYMMGAEESLVIVDHLSDSIDASEHFIESQLLPYQDEPVADEEWVQNYHDGLRERQFFLETLLDRFNNRVPLEQWCICGNCRTNMLQNEKEIQCCQELDECIESLNSEMVLGEMKVVPKCITLHPAFNSVCLDIWSLRMAGPKFRKIDGRKYAKHDDENRYLRSVAYREFTQLVHGYLGRKRIPLPACAYHSIRTRFPGKDF
ncbi:uncharacterized protein LOC124449052 [Xenia sp. Carnegie-2017]|uniref:uncharacterized protein LOC124449052 n=1 Tax=Xenia sp. Carnegie-2017 TaxID=2897299 RepID=UPI001F03C58F|nr:uncharacterized protein LOC124449052 [Xenia sp. Carnegie-2017]